MKISVLQEDLVKNLNLASRCVSSKAAIPILSHLLLSTNKGKLKISATNLETGINLWVGVKIEKEGEITVPAKVLSEYVASLSPGKLDLEVRENNLYLTSGQAKASFVGTAATEFPQIPSFPNESVFIFEKQELVKALSQVAFAAAQDEGRPVLTGVLLRKNKEKTIDLVATDGYRLSLKNISLAEDTPEEDLLIPAKTLLEITRFIQDKNE